MRLWTINEYVSSAGRGALTGWLPKLPSSVEAELLVSLAYLVQRPREEWIRPSFDMLHGAGRGLGEIRFKVNKVCYRPIGYFGPETPPSFAGFRSIKRAV